MMADTKKTPAMLLDDLVTTLRQVSETFAEVPDGKIASHALGVLAHLLDPA